MHFYHIADPMALTLEKWNGLLMARRMIQAADGDSQAAFSSAKSDRQRWLEEKRGYE